MLLAVDGWVIFLPGILDIAKFTNILVGHSHLAMGGMVSALNVIILIEMGSMQQIGKMLSGRIPFILWNGGCLIYVIAMTLQGWREGTNPGVLFGYDAFTRIAYDIRLIAGLVMVSANMTWLWQLACFLIAKPEREKATSTLYPNPEHLGEHV
jgi:cytochrome c oxidase cbb3-type subunit I